MKSNNVKINENQMPRLYGSPSPDTIRKFLLKARNYFASKTNDAWERIEQVNQLDANGNNVVDAAGNPVMNEITNIESMLLIFSEGATAGRYPIPITVLEPVAVAGEVAFEREKKIVKWKNDMNTCDKQKRSIVNGKLSYSGELKLAIGNEIQDVMRRQAAGRDALDGNDPLSILNVLIATDFSPKATVAASPLVKYEEAIERFNGDALKQDYNETLDSWDKRFGAERVNLTNLANAAGKLAELPNDESMAYKFFMRTNGLYKQVRDDIKTGTRAGGFPATVAAAMDILRPFEKPVSRNNSNRPRGVYSVGKQICQSNHVSNGWSHKCPAHKSNDHNYNDNVCKDIIKRSGSSDGQQGKVTAAVNENRRGKKHGKSN